MPTFDFIYKCRQCGAVFSGAFTTDKYAAIRNMTFSLMAPPHHSDVRLYSTHGCGKGALGVADLQGYVVRDDEGEAHDR